MAEKQQQGEFYIQLKEYTKNSHLDPKDVEKTIENLLNEAKVDLQKRVAFIRHRQGNSMDFHAAYAAWFSEWFGRDPVG